MQASLEIFHLEGGEDANRSYCRRMARVRAEVAAGERIASVHDLLRGVGWCCGDLGEDRIRYARARRDELAGNELSAALVARDLLDRLGDPGAADGRRLLRASLHELRALLRQVVPEEPVADPGLVTSPDPIALVGDPENDPNGGEIAAQRRELAAVFRQTAERLILFLFCLADGRSAGETGRGLALRDAVLAMLDRCRNAPGITAAEGIDLDLVEAGVAEWSVRGNMAETPVCLSTLRESVRRETVRRRRQVALYGRLEADAQGESWEILWRAGDGGPHRHPAGRSDPDREEEEEEETPGAAAGGDSGAAPTDPSAASDTSEAVAGSEGSAETAGSDRAELLVIPKVMNPENHAVPPFVQDLERAGMMARALPLICCRDVAGTGARLKAAFPHWADVIDDLLREMVEGRPVRLRPTLLVGAAGIGKTELARALARELGVGDVVFPCAATRDGTFAGTARGWGTATLSAPVLAVLQHKVANPLIILDELEKAGGSRHNGDLHSVLLGMLDQADAWQDPVLLAPVDLSAFNWVATANSLEGLNRPLRDRFRILHLDPPRREHAPALIGSIHAQILKDRGGDAAEPLSGEEIDAVCRAWTNGSLRGLRRFVEAVLAAREHFMTRH